MGEYMEGMKSEMASNIKPTVVELSWQRTEVTNLCTTVILEPGVSVDELIDAIEGVNGLEMDRAGPESGGLVLDRNERLLATFRTPDWLDYYEQNKVIDIGCEESDEAELEEVVE